VDSIKDSLELRPTFGFGVYSQLQTQRLLELAENRHLQPTLQLHARCPIQRQTQQRRRVR